MKHIGEHFGEIEREHVELEIAAGQLCGELSREEVGVGAGDEDGPSAIGPIAVDEIFKALDVLYLVDKEVFRAPRPGWRGGVYKGFEPIGRFHAPITRNSRLDF